MAFKRIKRWPGGAIQRAAVAFGSEQITSMKDKSCRPVMEDAGWPPTTQRHKREIRMRHSMDSSAL